MSVRVQTYIRKLCKSTAVVVSSERVNAYFNPAAVLLYVAVFYFLKADVFHAPSKLREFNSSFSL